MVKKAGNAIFKSMLSFNKGKKKTEEFKKKNMLLRQIESGLTFVTIRRFLCRATRLTVPDTGPGRSVTHLVMPKRRFYEIPANHKTKIIPATNHHSVEISSENLDYLHVNKILHIIALFI